LKKFSFRQNDDITFVFSCKVVEEEVPSESIVPGDVIAIKNMSMMQCDAVLLNGNVIVNESMLTGESVPVTKTALSASSRGASVSLGASMSADHFKPLADDVKLNIKEHSRHIIFSGTQVIQTRFYENEKIRAVVLRTGFNTTKGELIRAILHPKPVDFRFNNDTYKYIGKNISSHFKFKNPTVPTSVYGWIRLYLKLVLP